MRREVIAGSAVFIEFDHLEVVSLYLTEVYAVFQVNLSPVDF